MDVYQSFQGISGMQSMEYGVIIYQGHYKFVSVDIIHFEIHIDRYIAIFYYTHSVLHTLKNTGCLKPLKF